MKRTLLVAVLISLAAICMFATDASAYYDPGTGRFLSRDPGPGGGAIVSPRAGTGGGFLPRDPAAQYHDGMNLYQYTRSNPLSRVDPLGLKSGDVCSGIIGKQKKIYFKTPPSGDKWGHWWIWMGSESYGWWPKEPVPGKWAAISGVPGEMNARYFGGTATTDPYHYKKGEKEFKTKIKRFGKLKYGPKKGTKCKCVTCDDAKACIRAYAGTWTGEWKYPGRNCHTFQRRALKKCCLKKE